jgi:DNA-binding transcriptional regulator YhcF (GntR family)
MLIQLDRESPVPPFEQIRLQILDQIASGSLVAGTRLPTVRRLALDLDVAPNTVGRAYKELEAAGLITAKRRAGTVVTVSRDLVRQEAEAAALTFATRMAQLGINNERAIELAVASLMQASPSPPRSGSHPQP